MRRFTGHGLAKAPECCAGEFSATLSFQHLRSARDKPHAFFRCHIGVNYALYQRERARSRSSHVLCYFPGRCLCPMTVQCREMHDAAERYIVR